MLVWIRNAFRYFVLRKPPQRNPRGIFDGDFQFTRGQMMAARAEGQREFMDKRLGRSVHYVVSL